MAEVDVEFEYRRHVGPRYVHGGLTLRFRPTDAFAFESTASWPTSDNYDVAIRKAIETVLLEQFGALPATRVQLLRIGWDAVASCQDGFQRAARAAVLAALAV